MYKNIPETTLARMLWLWSANRWPFFWGMFYVWVYPVLFVGKVYQRHAESLALCLKLYRWNATTGGRELRMPYYLQNVSRCCVFMLVSRECPQTVVRGLSMHKMHICTWKSTNDLNAGGKLGIPLTTSITNGTYKIWGRYATCIVTMLLPVMKHGRHENNKTPPNKFSSSTVPSYFQRCTSTAAFCTDIYFGSHRNQFANYNALHIDKWIVS